MNAGLKKYFIVAGEPSGDLHGGNLIKAIKMIKPNSSFMGHGGDSMKHEGMHIIEHIDNLSIMGFVEVIKHLPRISKIMKMTIDTITKSKPDRIILIDYPGFNLRLAKKLSHLNIPITYFILPQAWAWKEKRVETMKRFIDQAISIFPFEEKWYGSKNFKVEYLGHPFMDTQHIDETTKSFYERHKLNINEPILTLLPGSRQQEIDRHWPIYLDTIDILRRKLKNLQFLVGKSPHVNIPHCPEYLKIEQNAKKAMVVGTVALVSSGTATLECAIEDTPMVVCYKLSSLSWIIAQLLIKVKYSSIVNLIANNKIVPELLQNRMKPDKLVNELLPLLDVDSEKRKKMLYNFANLKELLGSPGVYERTAELIIKQT
jgi:lipid-A-disaccharide synthase